MTKMYVVCLYGKCSSLLGCNLLLHLDSSVFFSLCKCFAIAHSLCCYCTIDVFDWFYVFYGKITESCIVVSVILHC